MPIGLIRGFRVSDSARKRFDPLDLTTKSGEAGPIEDICRRVAHFFHCQVDPAHRLVRTVCALDVGGLAGTGNGSKRAIEKADDLTEVDIGRVACQEVSPALSLPTLQDALVPESEQDQLEKLRRDLLGPGEIGYAHRFFRLGVGEREERFDGVLGFLGEHRTASAGYVVAIPQKVLAQQVVQHALLPGCEVITPAVARAFDRGLLDMLLEHGGLR